MHVPRLIERKRDGGALTPDEWHALVDGYVGGRVPDYQMAALAMAVMFRGLTGDELAALTEAMLDSGERLAREPGTVPRVDKHSLGGVGDKTSLLLAPMLAELGAQVPMISGRGLGHTGGTLDKLEAIPGFRTDLDLAAARAQLDAIGVVMLGQTAQLVPADRKLYALRDVTGTVESIPLIAASIMSKKLAEGLSGLALDIKTGSGAFIADPAQSLALARTLIGLGESHGCRTTALVTAMDRPLGVACGNALEVREAIAGLEGRGPADLMEVTCALAVEMALVGGLDTDRGAARARVQDVLHSGRARERFVRLVAAQGGDPSVIDDPDRLPRAPAIELVPARGSGVVTAVEPRRLGQVIVELGGGRARTDDRIDPAVGLRVFVKPGDHVERGDPLVEIHAASPEAAARARRHVVDAIELGSEAHPLPLIGQRVARDGVEPWAG